MKATERSSASRPASVSRSNWYSWVSGADGLRGKKSASRAAVGPEHRPEKAAERAVEIDELHVVGAAAEDEA
jgi:hypothetical protein